MKGFGNTRIEVSGVMMEMKAEKYENHIKNGTMLVTSRSHPSAAPRRAPRVLTKSCLDGSSRRRGSKKE
ncbi:hypothetical protein BFJ63_vAg17711 [Fusarium oxysporum f. sp. narcissi]|uniref:Uncharacterized protein n=1 Tax=Fusarium oxysporum f. sp. narcissi TaxID=451672 RepID=A0A4Q2UXZ3_FUSOX|nr:hypothetical protein FOMA001_g17547 [Fusarium oxysporum f. sp. matthiolae]KAK2666751.1 hypothetical protein RAB80_017868 [Fusarium oxysporum f. sp. vasinfectum]KAK2667790.1 hypothetical protein RAB80_016981 [Fusarium oxysporum f. sp. vasinfectum]KAK2922928.1 hypothetical protein FoTM2_017170 [Fusarium oxysporum f. sp. vasinfectum]RYC79405.1 hypothetical protein BFJ63_vAg17711 [Fusarium oxysporum f. sp. narcissi]